MRFMTDIKFTSKGPHRIPTNYRIDIASLMKEGMKNENPDLHNRLWGDDKANSVKPYTYCVYIPEAKHVKGNNKPHLEFNHDRIGFTFSSNDPAIVINFYNSMLNISGKYPLFSNDVVLRNFHLVPDIEIKGGRAHFRLMSPMIVRNMNEKDDNKKRGERYITFDDPRFASCLYHSVSVMCRECHPDVTAGNRHVCSLQEQDFIFTPVNCKTVKVYHYKEVITAVSGSFILEAPDDVLRLVYDVGIGVRRSQGFGMVKLV